MGREEKMKVQHKATKIVERPLQECELERFGVKTRELVERKSVRLLVWYCFDVYKSTVIS